MIIILPSNTPAISYPGNKSSNFTIPLPHTLFTPSSEKWKVAISQLYFPLTFYNFEREERITLTDQAGDVKVLHPNEGVYETREKICQVMSCDTLSFRPAMEEGGGFEFILPEDYQAINFSPRLAKLMGFPENLKVENGERKFRSSWKFDPWINFRTIYIFSNVVKSRQVGMKETKLLQSITPRNFDFGATVSKTFFPLDLLEVEGEVHDTISIQVTDWLEQPIKFRAGSVVAKLIFEK